MLIGLNFGSIPGMVILCANDWEVIRRAFTFEKKYADYATYLLWCAAIFSAISFIAGFVLLFT